MRALIVGAGALGGLIAARLLATGTPVKIATRDAASARRLKESGLRVTGVGGEVSVAAPDVAAVDEYFGGAVFDLVALATKAHDAIAVASRVSTLLVPGGVLLPIQNGSVSQLLADRLGTDRVLGGISNLGATVASPGVCEQRNAGHLLIGELAGETMERVSRIRDWFGRAIDVRGTRNFPGAVWSKLLLNCSVTTIGALAGQTMRQYIASPEGRVLFDRTYDEALAVMQTCGIQPERMMVDPVPPGWNGRSASGPAHETWLGQILSGYGDLKPSMLQDFERGRPTEIDFINGYVTNLGRRLGIPTPMNAAIVNAVHEIERGRLTPTPALLRKILQVVS